MKLLIETCLNDLYIALIRNNKIINKIHIKNLLKKSDALPIEFKKLIKGSKINTYDIEEYYVTNGPGSFMGVRAGLLFASTLAGINKKPIFATSSLDLMRKDSKEICFDAKGDLFYCLKDGKVSLLNDKEETKINYVLLEKEISLRLKRFKKIDPFANNVNYVKEPKIG